MKYMNTKKKYQSLDLQLFAEDGGDDGVDGDDSGEGDDQDDDESDEDGEEEKKFSQKDVDDAIKKRIARERRKWQREQQKAKDTGSKEKPGDDGKEEDKEKQEAISKASRLEVKVACFEADVAKDAVDDVAALARAYMAADEDLDLEEAIEKVVKKYPQFKKGAQDPYEEEDEEPKKAWGERQKGKGKKTSGVEDAFFKKNPGLKID